MTEPSFSEYADHLTYMIADLFIRFVAEVEDIEPDDHRRAEQAVNFAAHLRNALEDSIEGMAEIEDKLATFNEPMPKIKGGDFEADVLRDLANLDNPRHRPVGMDEVKAWSRDYITSQTWT